MKKVKHKSEDRGHANHGWLNAKHSFSFAQYFDANKMQFGALRVLNDDVIDAKMGFGNHPHNNMEIITIPLEGELKHRDSMSNEWLSVTSEEVQVMSAGTGVEHSEINGKENSKLKLFQIWILPNETNVKPRYDQKAFSPEFRKNKFQTLVSGFSNSDETNSLKIYQDAKISRLDLNSGKQISYHVMNANKGVYVMNIAGEVSIGNEILGTRDALGISDTLEFKIEAKQNSELLFIEVPIF